MKYVIGYYSHYPSTSSACDTVHLVKLRSITHKKGRPLCGVKLSQKAILHKCTFSVDWDKIGDRVNWITCKRCRKALKLDTKKKRQARRRR